MRQEYGYRTVDGHGEAEVKLKFKDWTIVRRNSHAVWTGPVYGTPKLVGKNESWIDSRIPAAVANHWLQVPNDVRIVSFGDVGFVNEIGEMVGGVYVVPGGPASEMWLMKDGSLKVVGEPLPRETLVTLFMVEGADADEKFKLELDTQRKRNGVEGGVGTIMWSSWSALGKEAKMEAIVAQLEKLKKIGVEYVIIDDAWQRPKYGYGDWVPNKDFKELPWLFDLIKSYGMKPGIWIAPFMASPDSEVYQNNKDYALKVNGDFPNLSKLVSGDKALAFDIKNPNVRRLAMANLKNLVEMGAELLKIDFLNITSAGDLRPDEKTVSQYTREFIIDLRTWLKENNYGHVKLFLCGPLADVADLSNLSRVSKDPADPPTKDLVLRAFRRRTHSKDIDYFMKWLERISSNKMTKIWIENATGVSIERIHLELGDLGSLKRYYSKMLKEHVDLISSRHIWGVGVAEPLWRSDGVSISDIRSNIFTIKVNIAEGKVRSVCFAEDMRKTSLNEMKQMGQMGEFLKAASNVG